MSRSGASAALPLILAVDPGSLVAGYAFLQSNTLTPRGPRDFSILDAGALKVKAKLPMAERIGIMHLGLAQLIEQRQPSHFVIERAFSEKNVASALKLGEVRGAFIAAATRFGLPVAELTPAEVKKTVGGHGRASKDEIVAALGALMGFERGNLPHDVSDAVAIGLSFGIAMTTESAVTPV